jgi:histidinol-phosphate aminotransferase
MKELVRKNILELQPYSCAQLEFKRSSSDAIFIDANENPYYNSYNRYPDPLQRELKEVIAKDRNISTANLLLGNGSDEIIDLLIRSFCEPAQDNIITFSPGYSMYEVCAQINNAEIRTITMTEDLAPDLEELKNKRDGNTKIIFLCSPNNPLGNIIPVQVIENILSTSNSLVVIDEAYIDFSDTASAISLINHHPNLVVMQTLSKSWAAAGLRLGICVASEFIISILSKVKLPYNISSISQSIAIKLLSDKKGFVQNIDTIKQERTRMFIAFEELNMFDKVYPSQANFILIITSKSKELYRFLLANGIVARLRELPPRIEGGIRFSIGTPQENNRLLEVLTKWKNIS